MTPLTDGTGRAGRGPGAAFALVEPPARERERRAFTLVELLVVLGVIALLIAILVPSLSQARGLGLSVVCHSNLSQLYRGLHESKPSRPTLKLPTANEWVAHVTDRGLGRTTQCPSDTVGDGGMANISQLYFVQNRTRFCYWDDVMEGRIADSQLRMDWVQPNVVEVWYGNRDRACAKCVVTLGDPIKIEVPDHYSHRDAGGCGSDHWVCWGDGGGDWESEVILQLKGVHHNFVDPRSPAYISGAPISYGMNNQVLPTGGKPDQVLLLDYHKTVVDVDGRGNADDDLDQRLAPRHLGRANVLTLDGAVRSRLPWELAAGAEVWKP